MKKLILTLVLALVVFSTAPVAAQADCGVNGLNSLYFQQQFVPGYGYGVNSAVLQAQAFRVRNLAIQQDIIRQRIISQRLQRGFVPVAPVRGFDLRIFPFFRLQRFGF